jgi:hypothetical protein
MPVILFLAMLGAGCGGRIDASPNDASAGDGGPGDAFLDTSGETSGDTSGDVDAADAFEPVTLVESTPADGAKHVSLLEPIKLRFSGALKPSSVTTTTVQLLAPGATIPMPADVAYDDASHTITLTPKRALYPAYSYRVVASGLRASDGAAIADAKRSFATLYDSLLDQTTYRATAPTTITSLWLYVLDAEGRTQRSSQMAAGVDGVFGTADDVPSGWREFVYGSAGRTSRYYSGAGLDGVWYTADDVMAFRDDDFASAPFGHQRSAEYDGAGADGIWGTGDDRLHYLLDIQLAADGREAVATIETALGPDGVAFTDDDVLAYYFVDSVAGNVSRRVGFDDPGVDGLWRTADDRVFSVDEYVFDADGRKVGQRYLDKGPDGVWLTSDDVLVAYTVTSFDAKGLAVRTTTYSGAGMDGVWGTADDVVSD